MKKKILLTAFIAVFALVLAHVVVAQTNKDRIKILLMTTKYYVLAQQGNLIQMAIKMVIN